MAHLVIVGGGQAAGAAAKTLRDEGFDGDVTVIAAESYPPYQRPPLSKGYLAGDEGADAAILKPVDWYGSHGIALRTGTAATALDAGAHRLALADGTHLTYDSVLLATGARPRALDVPGADLDGIAMLRTIDDADALATTLADGGRQVVVVGGGWIGMEVAATARTLGNDVTVLHRGEAPLVSALGADMGGVFRDLHVEQGVTVRGRSEVRGFAGTDRVTAVEVSGETIPADLVVVGIGAEPDTDLARTAGLRILDGVLVDPSLRASAPDVFAAGDVANAFHPVISRYLRSEHWANALAGGKVAARSMLGERARHDGIPYFFSDQFDLGMELAGYAPLMSDAEVVVRGDRNAREFIAFWVADGWIVGGMNVNVWDVNETVQRLIRSGVRVDRAALADSDVPLDSLLDA